MQLPTPTVTMLPTPIVTILWLVSVGLCVCVLTCSHYFFLLRICSSKQIPFTQNAEEESGARRACLQVREACLPTLTKPFKAACFSFSAALWAKAKGRCSFWEPKSAVQSPEGGWVSFGLPFEWLSAVATMSTSTAWDSQSNFQDGGSIAWVCLKVDISRWSCAQQPPQKVWCSKVSSVVITVYNESPPPPWHFRPPQLAIGFWTTMRNSRNESAFAAFRRESGATNRRMSPLCALATLPAGTVDELTPFWITIWLLLRFSIERISLLQSNHSRRCSREIQLKNSFLSSSNRWISAWCLPITSTSSPLEPTCSQFSFTALSFFCLASTSAWMASNQQDKPEAWMVFWVFWRFFWPLWSLCVSALLGSAFRHSAEPPQDQIFNTTRLGMAGCFHGCFEDNCKRESTLSLVSLVSSWLKCNNKLPELPLPRRLPPHVDCILGFLASSRDRRILGSRATSIRCFGASSLSKSQFNHCSPKKTESLTESLPRLHASSNKHGMSGSSPIRSKSRASSKKGDDARAAAADVAALRSWAFLALYKRWSLTISAWALRDFRTCWHRTSSFFGASLIRTRSSWRWPCKTFLCAKIFSSASDTSRWGSEEQHGIPVNRESWESQRL